MLSASCEKLCIPKPADEGPAVLQHPISVFEACSRRTLQQLNRFLWQREYMEVMTDEGPREVSTVRCIYLYIVVSPYVRGLPAYLHLYLYYILWPLAPR
jgi:hypothetical protein